MSHFSFPEELILLSVDGHGATSWHKWGAWRLFYYGIGAAILRELIDRGVLTLTENNYGTNEDGLALTGKSSTGDLILDQAFLKVKNWLASDKIKLKNAASCLYDVNALGQQFGREFHDCLVDKGVLRERKRKFLWVFPRSSVYEATDMVTVRNLQKHIVECLKRQEEIGAHDRKLIALAAACGLIINLLSPEDGEVDILNRASETMNADPVALAALTAMAWKDREPSS